MITAHPQIKLMALMLIPILFIAACNNQPKEKKPGQALVSVNDQEITILQLNDELRRTGVHADQYEIASKQLLESLIARQLIVDEAIRNKIDRTPEVMQARERANAQIIAQAYLQGIVNKVTKPSKSEIEEYFQTHPEYFAQRKQYDLTVLRIATGNVDNDLRAIIDAGKPLNEIIAWLDKRNIQYVRNLASRSTTDLPTEMIAMMQLSDKDRIFVINEKENSSLIFINAVKENPITLDKAMPLIEKYLTSQKHKQVTDAEINRLRSLAKIEYLNVKAQIPNNHKGKKPVDEPIDVSSNTTRNLNLSDSTSEGVIERAIMGLK